MTKKFTMTRNFFFISSRKFFFTMSMTIKKKNSCIIGFGSVSGFLGRGINVTYAGAKRGLESYFESMAFDKDLKNTNIQFYTLGYLETNLSFGKDLKSKFDVDTYRQWMGNFLMNVNNFNLVIYTNKESYYLFESLVENNSRIKVIMKEWDEFYGYKWKDKWIKT